MAELPWPTAVVAEVLPAPALVPLEQQEWRAAAFVAAQVAAVAVARSLWMSRAASEALVVLAAAAAVAVVSAKAPVPAVAVVRAATA